MVVARVWRHSYARRIFMKMEMYSFMQNYTHQGICTCLEAFIRKTYIHEYGSVFIYAKLCISRYLHVFGGIHICTMFKRRMIRINKINASHS